MKGHIHKMGRKLWIRICCVAAVLTQVCFFGLVQRFDLIYKTNSPFSYWSIDEPSRPVIVEDRTETSFSGDRHFYVFSVIAVNSSTVPTWDRLVVTGWERNNAENYTYKCCYLLRNGAISSTKQLEKRHYVYATPPIHAGQVVCGVNNKLIKDFPAAVALVLHTDNCNHSAEFHKPLYTMRHSAKTYNFAVHAKVIYGEKNPSDLIEWFEYQRFFGVDKVIMYPYALGEEPKRVLDYYVKLGFVETIPFARVPLYIHHPRMFGRPEGTMVHDEQVINYDAQERLTAYKYFTIIDTDEFIVPIDPNITSFTGLMEQLLSKYDYAASFTMYDHLHLTNWGKTDVNSKLLITQYGNHTETVLDTPKLLHVTDRILPGSARIHAVKGHKGYIVYRANDTDVILKHYRACRNVWLRPSKHYNISNQCLNGFKRIKDVYMDRVASAILPRVLNVRHELGFDLI